MARCSRQSDNVSGRSSCSRWELMVFAEIESHFQDLIECNLIEREAIGQAVAPGTAY